MTDEELTSRLHLLAETLDDPEVPLGDDLARGRRRARRHRVAIGGAALATAAVLTAGVALLPTLGGDAEAGPAGGGATPTGPETTPPVAPGETEIPPSPAETDDPPMPDPLAPPSPEEKAVLVTLRRAVAGHLDPAGDHITRHEIRQPNVSGGSGEAGSVYIEQKIGWRNDGEDGLGVVTVGVHNAFDIDCGGSGPGGPSATCTDTELAGLPVTRVEDDEVGSLVAYRRDDGYVTTVALDDLYGNNSLTPVSGIDVTDAQLAAVLTDPALDIPGHPAPVSIDKLAGTALRDVARDRLGEAGVEIVAPESWAGEIGGYWWADVRGADGVVGDVMLTDGAGNFAVDAPCSRWFATRCAQRTVDGAAVRIDYRRNKTGGGYDVTVAGERRTIWVAVSPDSSGAVPLAVDDAVALATDPRLQQ